MLSYFLKAWDSNLCPVKSLVSGKKRPGTGNNSTVLFLRCLVIIYIEINLVMEKAYWTYSLRAQLFNPAAWPHSSTPIYTNDSLYFERYSSNHLESQWGPFNYTALQFKYHLNW